MQDLETESLWSQVSGEAIQGAMEGRQLSLYPSHHTTYAEFKRLYPKGKLLKKRQPGTGGSRYADYFSAADKLGIFGRVDDFRRLPGKALVYGLRLEDRQVAISLEKLEADGLIVIDGDGQPIVVAYESESGTAMAYQMPSSASGKASDFLIKGDRIEVDDGAMSWMLATGAPAGESSGSEILRLLPILSSYWFAWVSFFPETELIQ